MTAVDTPVFSAEQGEEPDTTQKKKKKKKKKKAAAAEELQQADTDDFIRQAQEVEEQEAKLREIESKQKEL